METLEFIRTFRDFCQWHLADVRRGRGWLGKSKTEVTNRKRYLRGSLIRGSGKTWESENEEIQETLQDVEFHHQNV